jgi:hypothetical protein
MGYHSAYRDGRHPGGSAVSTWRSGWLGIEAYGCETHGFADLAYSTDGAAEATIHWLANNGEVYSPFRLRHDPRCGRVDLLESVSADLTEWNEEDTEQGWMVETSEPVPAHLVALLAADTSPERIFTALASVHAEMFSIILNGDDLTWDHHAIPGPGPDEVWRPADVGSDRMSFSARSSAPQHAVTPVLRRLWRATGPDGGGGYLADLGSVHLFVATSTRAGTPLYLPEQLTNYQRGDRVDIGTLDKATRDDLLAKIAFLAGPSPIS